MATTEKNAKDIERDAEQLEQYAFQLFSDRSSRGVMKRGAGTLAKACFRDAKEFMDAAKLLRDGDPKQLAPSAFDALSDASAPNLKPTHPLNLVSKRFAEKNTKKTGEAAANAAINRVSEIYAKLQAHPTAETTSEIDGLDGLEWDKATVNTARAIFPAFAKKPELAGVN